MKFISNLQSGRVIETSNTLAFESSELVLEVLGALRNESKEEVMLLKNKEHELFEIVFRGSKVMTPKGMFSFHSVYKNEMTIVFMSDELGDTSTIEFKCRNKYDFNILEDSITPFIPIKSIGDHTVLCNPFNNEEDVNEFENCLVISSDQKDNRFICKLWNGNFEPMQALIIKCDLLDD